MNDSFGEVVNALGRPSSVSCTLEPVVGDTIFLTGEGPVVAGTAG